MTQSDTMAAAPGGLDARFGLTRQIGGLDRRLRLLCETLAESLGDPDQVLRVAVACGGGCPAVLHGMVLRVALELVGNAISHGFHRRLVGCVQVDLATGSRGTTLVVADDGWGLGCRPGDGRGPRLVRRLVDPLGGTLTLRGRDGVTAEVFLPHAGRVSVPAAS